MVDGTGGASEAGAQGTAFRLVGKPQCLDTVAGAWRDLPRKGAALLALLACDGARSRAAIAALLWPDQGGEQPRVNLRGLLRDLRAASGRALFRGADTLELAADAGHDLHALHQPVQHLAQAPAGGLLGAFDYGDLDDFDAWLAQARARWLAARQRALHALAQQLEHGGRLAEALAVGERLVADDALDETGWRLLMRLHHRRDDPHAALAAFARCRTVLQREIGGDVAQSTRALATLIELGEPFGEVPGDRPQAPLVPERTVARQAELAAIRAAWAAGQRVCVDGEPGIGKSRLLAELVRDGPAVVLVAALADDAEVPFATLVRLLRALLAWQAPAWPAEVGTELARLLPELGPAPATPARTPRLAQALGEALAGWHRQGLAALLIDDLHWADGATLALLLPALQAAHALPVLVACRAAMRPPPLQACIDLQPQGWCSIRPAPLDAGAVGLLLRSLPLQVHDMAAWAEVLAARSLGSPLHIVETLLALRTAFGERVFRGAPPAAADLPVPASLDGLVQARLQRLTGAERQLAQLAALSGTLFSAALATAVMERNELELAALWSHLESAGVLQGTSLAHGTLREPLLAGLPAPLARALHARVADHGQAHGAAAAEVARHWQLAGAWGSAAQAFERAAAEALALNARAEELRLWDQAADCHARLGRAAAAHAARTRACDAALSACPVPEAQARADALLAASSSEDERFAALLAQTRVALLSHDLQRLLQAGEEAAGIVAALQARGALPPEDHRRLEAACAFSLGLAHTGQAPRALGLLDEVQPDAAACTDRTLLTAYHAARGTAAALAQRPAAEAVTAYGQALALARDADDVAGMLQHLVNLSGAHGRAGQYAESLACARESSRLHRRLGKTQGVMVGVTRMLEAIFCGRCGRYDEALDGMQQAMDLLRAGDALAWLADAEGHLAMLHLDLGRPAAARQVLQTPPAAADDHRIVRQIVLLRLARADGQGAAGAAADLRGQFSAARPDNLLALELLLGPAQPPAQAVRACQRVADEAARTGALAIAQHGRVRLVEALQRAGRLVQAGDMAEVLLASLPACQPYLLYLPEAWWVASRALAAAGRPVAARQAWDRARVWLLDEALPHVPAALREDFLVHNPVNRALLDPAQAQGPG